MNNERVTLAQELHDGIAQDLVGLGFSIDALLAGNLKLESKEGLRAIRFTVSELIEKVRREIHTLRTDGEVLNASSNTEISYELQRVFTEIIRNIEQHSFASHLSIHISDNGVGGATTKTGSFGLLGIQERVVKLNGDIEIDSTETGTKISIQIPLDR